MTAGLVAFLRARLDEDEVVARQTDETLLQRNLDWSATPEDDAFSKVVSQGFYVVARELSPANAAHIARHDPARVLREVEAKRATLAQYVAAVNGMDQAQRDHNPDAHREASAKRQALEWVIRRDAAIHADHPDFDPSWSE